MRLPRPLLYPLQRLLYRERFRLLNQLLANQQLEQSSLLQKQHHDLTALLKFAVSQVPYYHQRLGCMDWSTFPGCLPILQKADLIQYGEELINEQADRSTLQQGYTGGSTGTPLAYYYDAHKTELMHAGQYRSFMQCGWRPGEPVLQFWGASQDQQQHPALSERIHTSLSAEQIVGAYQFDEATLQQWSDTLCSYRPVVVRGYPSILAALARYLIDQGIKVPTTIKGSFCTAEVLHPQQRQLIEQAFHCKLYNQYGSREIPNISCECSHGNQHIYSDLVLLESLEVKGQRELVVTSLTNRLQPLIRYAIGDTGTLQEGVCSCGSPFPMMKMEVCRSNDLIHTPQGGLIYPSQLTHLLDGVEGIHHFQFRQQKIEQITLQVEMEQALSPPVKQRLLALFAEQVTPSITLEVERVEHIERGASGKHRFVRCDLS
ncbi:MAG: phenylacetate--CoA ligase family protein [Gammaproteobacteria bacterium]|mgnify:CR=1 FL=1|jgi:phenylacetate-CoA ligase|nr:phenylacetate--CoA ligase family protein [Gammaproteobacteria bacterium]